MKRAVIVFGVALVLTVPWNMFLEYLKQDNPQLSTSFIVRMVPMFLALVIYSMKKPNRNKGDGDLT